MKLTKGPSAMKKKESASQAVQHHGKHCGGSGMSKKITAEQATKCRPKSGK